MQPWQPYSRGRCEAVLAVIAVIAATAATAATLVLVMAATAATAVTAVIHHLVVEQLLAQWMQKMVVTPTHPM